MNFKISYLIIGAFLVFGFGSCYDEHKDNFSDYSTAATVQVGNVSPGFFNFVDPEAAFIAFDVSINENSDPVSEVVMYKSYNNGTLVEFRTLTTFPTNEVITLAQASEGLVDFEDVMIGDVFRFTFRIFMDDGRVINPIPTVAGVVSCPSDLAGTYDGVSSGQSTDGCCPDPISGFEKEITISSLGDGTYTVSDISGGLYYEWYDVYNLPADYSLPGKIRDVCDVITIFDTSEPFGTAITGGGSVDPNTGVITITWTNGYDDEGTVVLTPQ